MRNVQVVDDGWEFSHDREPDRWDPVTLPHAWGEDTSGVEPARLLVAPRGVGTYRRPLMLGPLGGDRVVLEVGAAGTVADVSVDGTPLCSHRGGYGAFRCDLTDALDADGRGTLTIRVDNSPTDDVYPLMGDHTIFGGLYRGARLVRVPPVHIDLAAHGGPGVVVRQVSLDEARAEVSVTVSVAHHGTASTAASVAVQVHIVDAGGTVVARAQAPATIEPGAVGAVTVPLTVDAPRRWDGRRDPYLYRVVAEVHRAAPDAAPGVRPQPRGDATGDDRSTALDRVALPLGLRTIEVDPATGVSLNGRPYRLHGVSRHHDVDGSPAVTHVEIVRDLDLICEIGATSVRLAHYQHAEDVLDLCDERGLLVWAEIPVNAKVSPTDPLTNAEAQLTELIHQQRHHPSIVCWGVQNEAVISEAVTDPRPATEALAALARTLDPDRPVTQAQVALVRPDDPINRLCDLNALNLYAGWYYGRAEEVAHTLDAHHAAYPDVPVGLSEYGADARTEFHTDDPRPGDYTEEYQAVLHETYWRVLEERPWVWASYVWNMFDFASSIRDEGGTRGFNMKGLVTRDRQVRKDAFWWYKANWSDEPVLHICGARHVHRHTPEIEVKVYANHPEVRLTANGVDAGAPERDGRIFRWRVHLGEGETSIVARAGDHQATATFVRVDEADPAYLCPAPRRVRGAGGGDGMSSWYEDADITVDLTTFGTWTLVGELLDEPATRAILVERFGEELLAHPMLEMARDMPLDMVLSVSAPDMDDAELRALHERIHAVPKPTLGEG